jgi:putative transposase
MSKRKSRHPRFSVSCQVRQAILSTLTSHLSLGISGRHLDDEKVFDILVYASATGTSIESGCNELENTPSGNTVRDHLNKALSEQGGLKALEAELNDALQSQLPASLCRRFDRKAFEIGIDLTEIPYHGEPEADEKEVRRGKPKSGTSHFHTYATLAVVHHRKRYEIALTFVFKGEPIEKVVQRLIKQARSIGLRIRRAYLDKGFCSKEVFRLLRRHRIPYLIPIPKRGRSGGIRDLFVGRKSYKTRYTFYPNDPKRAYTTEVIVLRRKVRGHYTWMAFATYGMEQIPLHQIFECYRRRFGIETGYRQMHITRARTTSRSPCFRLLLIGLALIIYNAYITLRQVCFTKRQYGSRSRSIGLTFKRLIHLIIRHLERLLHVTSIEALQPG